MNEFDQNVASGLASLEQGDISAAKDLADRLGSLPPEDAGSLSRAKFFEFLGNLALREGRSQDALDAYRFMIRYEERGGESMGGIGNSWGKLGEAHAQLGNHGDAVTAFERGIAMMQDGGMAPEFIATMSFQLAESLNSLGDYRRSADEFARTIGLAQHAPDSKSLAYLNSRLGTVLSQLAAASQVLSQIDEFLAQAAEMNIDLSSFERPHFDEPDVPFREQMDNAFWAAIKHAKDANNNALVTQTYAEFGGLVRTLGDAQSAAEILAEGVQFLDAEATNAASASLLEELGEAFCDLGMYEEAVSTLQGSVELYTILGQPVPWTHLALARAYSGHQQHDEAIAQLNLAQADLGHHVDALRIMADVFEAAGETTAAQESRDLIAQLENEV
ncbi:MAG: tetratricopeptide repeat protein [bacterium]